jgi:hypothetical protein
MATSRSELPAASAGLRVTGRPEPEELAALLAGLGVIAAQPGDAVASPSAPVPVSWQPGGWAEPRRCWGDPWRQIERERLARPRPRPALPRSARQAQVP